MLENFVIDQNTILFKLCATKVAFFLVFIGSELFILSAMSYNLYVAIYKPLFYTVLMSRRVCWVHMAMLYLYCTFVSLLITIKIFTSSFCGYNVIHHFYCDCIPLLFLLCSNTEEIAFIVMIFAAFDLVISLLVVLMSYTLIRTTGLRTNSAEGR